jgi:hypothetical protein
MIRELIHALRAQFIFAQEELQLSGAIFDVRKGDLAHLSYRAQAANHSGLDRCRLFCTFVSLDCFLSRVRAQRFMRIRLLTRFSQSFAFFQSDILEFAQTRHVLVSLLVSVLTRPPNRLSSVSLKVVYTKSAPLGIAQAGHSKDEQWFT